ncbi:flavonoid 3'-monooxygenase CYP75B3 [Triticum aestivum]|uniref:Flavonoid 3',5'-hydroxylase 1-like 1 n=1 Tax=Triticum aestivum TaxID=4565 RepID=A0A346D785_WHEAT|nr:flavonoid 3'-monooxygenase CYP75B3-like [Triticum aestivum]AXM42900.1 flavonoid 3',5'-hydroxylase 1-like 1 [Triticum aestivum]
MTVSLLTGTGKFNISDFVPALSWLDLQGVQAKLRRVHRQFDGLNTKLLVPGGARGNGRRAWEEGRLDFVDMLRLVAWSRPGRGGKRECRAEDEARMSGAGSVGPLGGVSQVAEAVGGAVRIGLEARLLAGSGAGRRLGQDGQIRPMAEELPWRLWVPH